MKKIIIVNNNMKVGGVQKSLCNLLSELAEREEYDVSLLLFNPAGDYIDRIPPRVKILSTKSLFKYIGISQSEAKGLGKIKRGFLAGVCRVFGRAAAMRLMLMSQKKISDSYDCAIAFLHNGGNKSFYGGVQEFVLRRVDAKKKIAFIHCDYDKSGANNKNNNNLLDGFDVIAACSDGCRGALVEACPHLAHKAVTVRNCNNVPEIRKMADEDTVIYDTDCLNVVTVARLSPTKGIDRAIKAVEVALKEGASVRLHILGGGSTSGELKDMVSERGLDKNVIFYGEQINPYRYMKNADLFLLTSFHEAAPMVIDEAYVLGVPTLTTRTTSSDEMVTKRGCGWVCENDQESLNKALLRVLNDPGMLNDVKSSLRDRVVNNDAAMSQLIETVG